MSISMIAAVGRNFELGKNNDLIWHFKEDMKFFRETTSGSTVIMGRKTFDSLPKVLPNRRNIIISGNKELRIEGAQVVSSVDEAIAAAGKDSEVFIIGGAQLYKEFLPLCSKIYLTEIDDGCSSADTYFPYFDKSGWERRIIKECISGNISFSHVVYERK